MAQATPPGNDDHKQAILSELDKLRMQSVADKQVFKARAYAKAIAGIKGLENPILSVDDIAGVPGIGDRIREKIGTIIETGHLQQTSSINTSIHDAMLDLMRVHGIGPSKAKELVSEHDIRTVSDLRTPAAAALLTHAQIIGLRYLEDFEKRIPRKEMERHEGYLSQLIGGMGHEFHIVGSYRRGQKTSGDIDVLVRSNDPGLLGVLTQRMVRDRYIVETMAKGDFKFMGACKVKYGRNKRRLDILVTSDDEYPFALLYFTGDAEFNKKMRAWVVAEKQLSLSEHGLKDMRSKQFVQTGCKTERDIFKYLGIEYVEPADRSSEAAIVPIHTA